MFGFLKKLFGKGGEGSSSSQPVTNQDPLAPMTPPPTPVQPAAPATPVTPPTTQG